MQSKSKRIILNTLSAIITFFIVISSIFLAIGIVLNCVYIKTTVRGYSMQPTLNMTVESEEMDGDIVYINKYRDYNIGDIIVAKTSVENTRYVIKRLVGLEGDLIRIEQVGDVYNLLINEEILYSKTVSEVGLHGEDGSVDYYNQYLSFIYRHKGTDRIVTNADGEDCIKIGNNECFLMGDNWGETTDSIFYGTLNVSLIVGKVDIVIPYGESHFKGLIKSLWNILT